MAIVKFVSDKDCQIFIDKECVGEVAEDSILKLTLEPGGYLVEVKDNEAHILKKYNLEIKATDNQVLQDVSREASSLDDVINQLRNDPSLEFHCGRASFRHNGLYGYVNKRFEVVIPPIYIVANKFKDNRAFVVREFSEGKKTTLIDEDGNMFFNRWFDYIGESDETILLGIDNRIIVYSKIKYDKKAEYLNAGYDFKYPLVPAYKKVGIEEYFGFIDFGGKEVIPFLFDKAGNFNEKHEGKTSYFAAKVRYLGEDIEVYNDGYYVREKDSVYRRKSWSTLKAGDASIILDNGLWTEKRYGYYPYGNTSWDFIPIWKVDKWAVKIITTVSDYRINHHEEKELIVECDRILDLKKGYCVCKVDNKILVVIVNHYANDMERIWFDADAVKPVLEVADDNGYDFLSYCAFVVRNNGKYGLADKKGALFVPIKCDNITIVQTQNAIISQGGKLAVVNLNSQKIVTPFEYDEVVPLSANVLLLKRCKKYGLLTNEDLITPMYDNIIYCGLRNIVVLDGKYGIVDSSGNIILPIEHKEIVPLGENYFKVKTEGGWSLGYMHHGIIYSGIYDNISLFEDNGFMDAFSIEKNKLYGCINDKGKILIPCEFERIELYSTFYNPRNYSFRIYKNGKVGFCDVSCFYSDYIICKRTGSYDFEYVFIVAPVYEECELNRNNKSVLNGYYMHYAAVRRNGKWGILDQKPRRLTYHAIDANLEDENEPNLTDLDFKYDTLEDLKNDADYEFQRRYDKYYKPWELYKERSGKYWIVEKGAIIEEPSYK